MISYVYVIVRLDIPLHQQAVQACHVSLEAGFSFDDPGHAVHLIYCAVKNQDQLIKIADKLDTYDVKFKIFNEPWWDMGYSAIATEPLKDPIKPLKKLKLWNN